MCLPSRSWEKLARVWACCRIASSREVETWGKVSPGMRALWPSCSPYASEWHRFLGWGEGELVAHFRNEVGSREEVCRFRCRVFHNHRSEPWRVGWRAGPPAHERGIAETLGMGAGDDDGSNGKPLARQESHDSASTMSAFRPWARTPALELPRRS